MILAAGLLAVSVNAQQRDPGIGEWREDYYPGGVGLYMIYEDLGNGMIRVHSAENLAPQNRQHQDLRCNGKFYPSAGLPPRAGRVNELATLPRTRLSGPPFLGDLPLRRSRHPTRGDGLVRRTVQHHEVGSLPCKGWLLAPVSLSLVRVLNRLGGPSSVSLSPVPRDDNGKPRGLSDEPVETSLRSPANDDTDRLS